MPSASRPPQPRPSITTQGSAQARESFATRDGKLDATAVSRALSSIQAKVADSTAQARANPLGNGHLFQGVQIVGSPTAGPTADLPGWDGLPDGFMFFDTTAMKPHWLLGTDWVDATGFVAYGANSDPLATTAIAHGFGTPAAGFLITNVQHAVIQNVPRLVLAGDSTDNNVARIWIAYLPLSTGTPTVDVYVFC